MQLQDLPLPPHFRDFYRQLTTLTPIQEKAIQAGLLQGTSLLACAPTASGKTLIASMGIASLLGQGKCLYVVPLKALASEKYREYLALLKDTPYKVGLSLGDVDADPGYLANYDLLILTSEKLDSLLRHKVVWLSSVKLVVIDEIHLLNDPTRGPTLEVIITLLRMLIKPQLICLSATIGNPQQLSAWLGAELIIDHWRPVELRQGVECEGRTEFYRP